MQRLKISTFLSLALILPACGEQGDAVSDGWESSEQTEDDSVLSYARHATPESVQAAREGRSYLVEYDADHFTGIGQQLSALPVRQLQYRDVIVVDVEDASQLDEIKARPGVIAVYPNRLVEAVGKGGNGGGGGKPQPGDGDGDGDGDPPREPEQTPAGVAAVGAPNAWSVATGAGVGVAILDTGIDFSHPDLNVGIDCHDSFGGNCEDQHGHGTHVAGIVAAMQDGFDVVGVAPDATVYAARVLDASGSGSDADIIAGLDWVAAHAESLDISVANMSLGRPGNVADNPLLEAAVNGVVAAGVTVVVAAGNDPGREFTQNIPAAYPSVIPVASVTAEAGSGPNKGLCAGMTIDASTASYFTTDGWDEVNEYGPVSAPGETTEDISKGCSISSNGILSDAMGGGTTRKSGTSMASPTVAGVVALLEEATAGAITTAEIRDRLQLTSTGCGAVPLESKTGAYTDDLVAEGVVNAEYAVLGTAQEGCPPSPPPPEG